MQESNSRYVLFLFGPPEGHEPPVFWQIRIVFILPFSAAYNREDKTSTDATSSSFMEFVQDHHQQLLPFTIITFTEKVPHWGGLGLLPDLPREEGVEKFDKTPKSGQNFSWHLYYMLKMQFTLKLNRIPGGPIPFSLLEILPFLPQGLPRLPSPGSTLIELKKNRKI